LKLETVAEAQAVALLQIAADDELAQAWAEHSTFDEMDLRAQLRFDVRHAAQCHVAQPAPALRLDLDLCQCLGCRNGTALGVLCDAGSFQDVRYGVAWNAAHGLLQRAA